MNKLSITLLIILFGFGVEYARLSCENYINRISLNAVNYILVKCEGNQHCRTTFKDAYYDLYDNSICKDFR